MRKIIHIDMDCFFAAIEMRDNPKLQNIPIAIINKNIYRGVINTANYPARKFGVCSAMPISKALKLCPHLTLLPSRYNVYKEVSTHIQNIFSRYTSQIQPLSLDEAYLDVTDSLYCHGSASLIAQKIRLNIFRELKITSSAGIAPVMFLAKIASTINKPGGQFVITPYEIPAFLKKLSLSKIPGIGKVLAAKLKSMGLRNCEDVQKSDLILLIKRFGRLGLIVWEYSQGIDKRTVSSKSYRKSLSIEQTLAKDIYNWPACKMLITHQLYPSLVDRLSKINSDLRIAKQGIKLKFNDFQQTTQEKIFPILNMDNFIAIAKEIWDRKRVMRGVRLVGLHVTLLNPQFERQLSFKL